jgi:hypothetical protein
MSNESHNDNNDDVKSTTYRCLFFDKEETSLKARKKSKAIVPCDNFKKSDQKNTHRKDEKTQRARTRARTRRLQCKKIDLIMMKKSMLKLFFSNSSDELTDCYVCLDQGCPFCGREHIWPGDDSD